MRTAIDTNIISGLWSGESDAPLIAKRLAEAKSEGALLISGIVYCELLAYPGADEDLVRRFCKDGGIALDLRLEDTVWGEAGGRFAAYAERRRKSKETNPKRLLADFIVGAHALVQADRLMTVDVMRYRQDFPELLSMDCSMRRSRRFRNDKLKMRNYAAKDPIPEPAFF